MSEQILAEAPRLAVSGVSALDRKARKKKEVLHAAAVSYWLRIQGLLPKSALIKTDLTDSLWLIP